MVSFYDTNCPVLRKNIEPQTMMGCDILEKEKKASSVKDPVRHMTLLCVLLLFFTCALISSYSGYRHYERQLNCAAEMLSAASDQISLTATMYFKKLEDTSLVLLSDPEILEFDASDEKTEQFLKQQKLGTVEHRINDLSVMDNYSDFAVIYKNNVYAGNISDTTMTMLRGENDDMYQNLRDTLDGQLSVWLTGIDHEYEKVYFVREVNENACFIGSFYMTELADLLKPEANWENMHLMLYDGAGRRVINLGNIDIEPISFDDPSRNYSLISGSKVQENKMMRNGWTLIMVKEMQEVRTYYRKIAFEMGSVLMIALVALVVCGVISSKGIGPETPESGGRPPIDALTGLNNAEAAENLIADKIETCISGSTIMLALVRIVNLKDIEKKYGRSAYNGSIIKTYRALATYFGTDAEDSKNIIGRTGENEFVVFADFTEYDLFKAHDNLKASLEELALILRTVHIQIDDDIRIYVGAAVYPDSSNDYDELYDMASVALKQAIEAGEPNYALHRKAGEK